MKRESIPKKYRAYGRIKVMPGYKSYFVYIKHPSWKTWEWKAYGSIKAAERARKKYGIKRKKK
jgi:hypothetical protein